MTQSILHRKESLRCSTQVLNGLQLGEYLCTGGAWLHTMVYGIILLNFAHGDIIMFSSYVAWIALVQLRA